MPNDASATPCRDPRVKRSRDSIRVALLSLLMEGRSYPDITVSELASRAKVTRKTMYAHFASVDDVVRQSAEEMFRDVLDEMDHQAFQLPIGRTFGRAVFAGFARRLPALQPLATRCPSHLFVEPARAAVSELVIPRLINARPVRPLTEFEAHYLAYLSAGALHAALTGWAARDFGDDPDLVADILMRTVAPVTNSLLAASTTTAINARVGAGSGACQRGVSDGDAQGMASDQQGLDLLSDAGGNGFPQNASSADG
ncbi:MAG: TetR/AcrR family transcriptional regulator [Mycobacterium sp.]|nr:TetR/AcrR family transcriptional regulator [Mycobacterium sp.]